MSFNELFDLSYIGTFSGAEGVFGNIGKKLILSPDRFDLPSHEKHFHNFLICKRETTASFFN